MGSTICLENYSFISSLDFITYDSGAGGNGNGTVNPPWDRVGDDYLDDLDSLLLPMNSAASNLDFSNVALPDIEPLLSYSGGKSAIF
jgi:hypothetical protein